MAYPLDAVDAKALLAPVAQATALLARLDERLARSPVRDGLVERQHFADAAAALWLEGELVDLEDLVLHDARMDIRTPTHELTRAHAVLRARRLILSHEPEWPLSRDGLSFLALARRTGATTGGGQEARGGEGTLVPEVAADVSREMDEPDALSQEFAAIDAVLARSNRLLDGSGPAADRQAAAHATSHETSRPPQSGLVYDLDWNEDERLAEWQDVLASTRHLPAVLRAATLLDAWSDIEVLQHAAWLGPLFCAALLRQDGVAAHHLAALHVGAKTIPRERRRARASSDRLLAFVDAVHEAALAGLKDHDRLMLAKSRMERRLTKRRASSKLPDLVELVLARPIVSTGMIQDSLKISKQGALNLVGELGLREMTGRGRFRAWGIV